MADDAILIEGARQNNLKDVSLHLPLNELIVVTGVSGSGKSSLAFDIVYSEGQRRYVETFSPYARQFLERMDRPKADRIEGILPAIAIDQTNPVRTSRSTVGTMTELNDHLKVLFARAARLYCQGCGREVARDTPQGVSEQLLAGSAVAGFIALISFPVTVPDSLSEAEVKTLLAAQGYSKTLPARGALMEVIQDRVKLSLEQRERIVEALEAAFDRGRGRVNVYPLDEAGQTGRPWRFSAELHCPDCDLHYRDPLPSLFSFNSPIGACETCRGFGRTIGIDYNLVVPDPGKTLAEGAVRPWQTESYRECQDDLLRFAALRGIPADVPWAHLSEAHRRWVLEGEGSWEEGLWYGVRRFFAWLETKRYKMHIRVLLSKYRAYTVCPDCRGARLKPDALLWRLGTRENADRVLPPERRFKAGALKLVDEACAALPGLTLHDLMLLPIDRCQQFFDHLQLPPPLDEATDLLIREIRARLAYLVTVGLGYLSLDRQSRTLSGGEVQRINLTTALGTSLVNTLFVLDEPSIGLHPRDIQRIIAILHQLRDAGNTLLVVEHDPQIMMASDRILDMGPGAGEQGGQVVFFGIPEELLRSEASLTAQYLAGSKTVGRSREVFPAAEDDRYLEILGAAEHNLKDIDVKIPLNRLVCVTGVSGSGKSTLLRDVCYYALRKLKGKPIEVPGEHRGVCGHEHIDEVILVDQSPIGKTTRSNPASYVGAFDAIRRLFAAEPVARERGYMASAFSFNSGVGCCPSCGGNGFERVEMQFLSDVYLRCPDCDGRRYRPEVLEVMMFSDGGGGQGKSIAGVLEMTVAEARNFFGRHREVLNQLEPLMAVGLDYLKLGQPVPTLSGGEAQRLKLAGHLAGAGSRKLGKGTLFLFDEPTTGLHFDDIAKLLQAFCRLLDNGHSLVVIEHNLDVIRAADWVIDLGPEGGEAGGELLFAGTPAHLMQCDRSDTGKALVDYEAAWGSLDLNAAGVGRVTANGDKINHSCESHARTGADRVIRIHNAREHNLKNIDVQIARDTFTVITGVSGSGKSTLAFDILFGEGQRRYLESLNAYARQFVQPASRPDVDAIFGIPPTVAIQQRTSRGGRKSTVATLTEIYHFLRLLFVKLGTQYCPDCDIPIEAQTEAAILAKIQRDYRGRQVSLFAPLVVARKGYYAELAKWAAGKGFPQLRVDGELMATEHWRRLDRFREHDIDLPIAELIAGPEAELQLREALGRAFAFGKGVVRVVEARQEVIFSSKRACPSCGRSFQELDPRLFSYNSKRGWCEQCYGTGLLLPDFDAQQSGEEIWWNACWNGEERICPACHGLRLQPEALAVRYQDRSIAEFTALSVADAEDLFRALQPQGREAEIAGDILAEIRSRLGFLREVGLSYLSLDRSAPTLSGGEAQRIRLAAQLGSNLRGVCYILDEPTIGLHPRDNLLLLGMLAGLVKKGNTVVVVEHDEETIRRAAQIIDLGPGAGRKGGRVVAQGSVEELKANPQSLTGRYLAKPRHHSLGDRLSASIATGTDGNHLSLEIIGANLHNLKDIDITIPLAKLVCVTGVSGSGKSTLVRRVLYENLRMLLGKSQGTGIPDFRGCHEIRGWGEIRRILEVDQTPIGKTPRSCPATYVGFWDSIRSLFAETTEARMRGYGPGRFSFNVRGGRCDACEGQGIKRIAMSFLPDVEVNCEVCNGARFNEETMAVSFKGKNVSQVLAMSVDEAADFFISQHRIHHPLRLLQDIGLGYLGLGQQSHTLSGGEAQRIKLVAELAKIQPPISRLPGRTKKTTGMQRSSSSTLFILDEPTVGLHMADVEPLVRVLQRLVATGNTMVVIEHNLDVIAEADWLIDLGPEGGEKGGQVVAQGTPASVASVGIGSHTAKCIKDYFGSH